MGRVFVFGLGDALSGNASPRCRTAGCRSAGLRSGNHKNALLMCVAWWPAGRIAFLAPHCQETAKSRIRIQPKSTREKTNARTICVAKKPNFFGPRRHPGRRSRYGPAWKVRALRCRPARLRRRYCNRCERHARFFAKRNARTGQTSFSSVRRRSPHTHFGLAGFCTSIERAPTAEPARPERKGIARYGQRFFQSNAVCFRP
jgi:hypothetical protein